MKQPNLNNHNLDQISDAQMQAFAEQFNAIEPGSGTAAQITTVDAWSGFDGLALMGGLSLMVIAVLLTALAIPHCLNALKILQNYWNKVQGSSFTA